MAEELYRSARAYVDELGGVRLEKVSVAVGELIAGDPGLLRAAWDFTVRESVDEGAILDVEIRQVRQRCSGCGQVPIRLDSALPRYCSKCHSALRAEGGRELSVLKIKCGMDLIELSRHDRG